MITAKIKSQFFDRPAVMRAVGKAKRESLGKGAALVRKNALFLIKSRRHGVYSSPGQPPYSHISHTRRMLNRRRKAEGKPPIRGGFRGIKHILYGYDVVTGSTVVGPIGRPGGGFVTHILEFGGRMTGRNKKGRKIRTTMRPRPYMNPALRNASPYLPEMWRNSVRGG